MSKVTVITITYNQEKFIKEALDSILSQKTNFDFEILVSDDHSTDNTPKIIKEYAKKYPKIIKPILATKNVGSMNNYLNTLDKAKSEYVAICDGDDYWCDDNKLQMQVDFLDDNKDYAICFNQTRVVFEDGSRPEDIFPSETFRKTTELKDLLKENYIPANSVMYRWAFRDDKKISDVIPNDVYPGDYFTHLIHAKHGKMYFINRPMSYYRRHSSGTWWLTSQEGGQDDFTKKYGLAYLKFFITIENTLGLEQSTFMLQKENLINNLIKYYLDRKMFNELIVLRKEYRNLFNACYDNCISGRAPTVYDSLSKSKKVAYLAIIDPLGLKQKIYRRIKDNKTVFFAYKRTKLAMSKIRDIINHDNKLKKKEDK